MIPSELNQKPSWKHKNGSKTKSDLSRNELVSCHQPTQVSNGERAQTGEGSTTRFYSSNWVLSFAYFAASSTVVDLIKVLLEFIGQLIWTQYFAISYNRTHQKFMSELRINALDLIPTDLETLLISIWYGISYHVTKTLV